MKLVSYCVHPITPPLPRHLLHHQIYSISRGACRLAATVTMASVLHRSACLRQSRAILSSVRPISQPSVRASTSDIRMPSSVFTRTLSSSMPQRQPSQQRPLSTSRSVSFHTSAAKRILPPGPREYSHNNLKVMSKANHKQRSLKGLVSTDAFHLRI